MQRKHFLATLSGLALATALPLAHAQDTKPLEWVVGYAAGGGSDIVARTIAESMSATLQHALQLARGSAVPMAGLVRRWCPPTRSRPSRSPFSSPRLQHRADGAVPDSP